MRQCRRQLDLCPPDLCPPDRRPGLRPPDLHWQPPCNRRQPRRRRTGRRHRHPRPPVTPPSPRPALSPSPRRWPRQPPLLPPPRFRTRELPPPRRRRHHPPRIARPGRWRRTCRSAHSRPISERRMGLRLPPRRRHLRSWKVGPPDCRHPRQLEFRHRCRHPPCRPGWQRWRLPGLKACPIAPVDP